MCKVFTLVFLSLVNNWIYVIFKKLADILLFLHLFVNIHTIAS